MKLITKFPFLLLALALPMESFGATHSKEVEFVKTTRVGSVDLQPGVYKVAWAGTGPNVEVDFSQDRKVVASVSAKLENSPSEFNSAIQTRDLDSGSVVLEEIDFKNTELKFSQGEQPAGN